MLFIIILSFMLLHTYSAPVSQIDTTTTFSQNNTGTCQDITTCRTTWTIIKSCLFTVFLCAWIAVHPNIPALTDTRMTTFLRRLKIMLWGLLAPELIIFWAMRQWFGARKVAKLFKAYGCTITHAHFIQMGGFILYKDNKPLHTLTALELANLLHARQIDFPKITQDEIEDRSKGDFLSKGLVIIQTLWFVIQLIARRIESKVITEIEVVTLAIAVLNGIIYFLWWNKPLDVRCAIPVHRKEPQSLHPVNRFSRGNGMKHRVLEKYNHKRRFYKAHSSGSHPTTIDTDTGIKGTGRIKVNTLQEQNASEIDMDSLPRQKYRSQPTIYQEQGPIEALTWAISVQKAALKDELEDSKAKPSRIFSILGGWLFLCLISYPLLGLGKLMYEFEEIVNSTSVKPGATRVPTFYAVASNTRIFGSYNTIKLNQLILSCIGTLTGLIHCIIWTSPFPSRTEQLLWRISTVLTTAYPFTGVVLVLFFEKIKQRAHTAYWVGGWQIIFGGLMLFGRLMLLVQGIVSLRKMPAGALDADSWSFLVPHL